MADHYGEVPKAASSWSSTSIKATPGWLGDVPDSITEV